MPTSTILLQLYEQVVSKSFLQAYELKYVQKLKEMHFDDEYIYVCD